MDNKLATLVALIEDAGSFIADGRTTFSFYVKPMEVSNADTVYPDARYLLLIEAKKATYTEMGLLSLIRPGQTVVWQFDDLESDDFLLRFEQLQDVRIPARMLG